MALRLQLVPHIEEVVDLTVEHDLYAAIADSHGLLTRGNVDDRQAAMSQGREIVHVKTFAIRPPMGNDVGHCLNARPRLTAPVTAEIDEARNAAHGSSRAL